MAIQKPIEDQLIKRIYDDELGTARRNKSSEDADFEGYINLLDSVREPKQYEWMSDVRLPEFISHVLTQASIDANQYFQSRDFVDVYIQDPSDEALSSADSAKELINRTLNQREIFHYSKYMRAKTLNNMVGKVYAKCWWEQEFEDRITGYKPRRIPKNIDENGEPIVDPENQTPAYDEIQEPVREKVAIVDRFNYDILDPRNVFTDNKYVYSLQQKDYIFVRDEVDLDQILKDAEKMNYFGLEQFTKEPETFAETETSTETYNKGMNTPKYEREPFPAIKKFDLYERFGKYWAIVKSLDETGYPLEVEPGIDEFGKIKEGAAYIEMIITVIVDGSDKRLIRFQPTPYRDANGKPYRPLIRGLCYIHPTNDGGIGDGKHVKELQLALDDTFNISNDRVMLATLPTIGVKRYATEDSTDVFFEPGHTIPLENPSEDINPIEIKDDIQGALNQIQLIRSMMQQVDAIYPTTMGDVPGLASTTATAVAGSETRSNMRASYKSLTFENTFLVDLYWMILNMTWQFAQPETGLKLMGEKVYNFDPSKDFFYKPITATIEPEYAKEAKVKNYSTILGYAVNLQHPDMVKLINYILAKMFENMGDEYANFGDKLLNPEIPAMSGSAPMATEQTPMSNQNMVPMSGQEMTARRMM